MLLAFYASLINTHLSGLTRGEAAPETFARKAVPHEIPSAERLAANLMHVSLSRETHQVYCLSLTLVL